MYNYRKEQIKNLIIITFILLLAIFSTHYIYYKFKDERNVDYNSDSLDVVFHEKTADKVTLTKVTPVTDSVGLSSKAYTLTITNNLTEEVNYQLKLIDDLETILEDDCADFLIDKENIKVAIKEDKKSNEIYFLNELKNNVLITTKIKPLGQKKYTIKLWIDKNSQIPQGSLLHYHGKIQIIEKNQSVALKY